MINNYDPAFDEVKKFFDDSIGTWTSHRNYYNHGNEGKIKPMTMKFNVEHVNDGDEGELYRVVVGKNNFSFRVKPFKGIITDCVEIIRGNSVSNIDAFPTYAYPIRDPYAGDGIRMMTDSPRGKFVEDIRLIDNNVRTRKSLILSNSSLKPLMIGLYLEIKEKN